MVDDVAGAWAFGLLRGWTWMLALEGGSGGSATLHLREAIVLEAVMH